jgi:RNA polymerase sigma factor (TIGR02999 family)
MLPISPDQPLDVGSLSLLLERIHHGDEPAKEQFCERVYDELRIIAQKLIHQYSVRSIEPTSLVNGLFVQFIERGTLESTVNRKAFFMLAIESMRHLLIDRYRRQQCARHGGNMKSRPLHSSLDKTTTDVDREYPFDSEALENAMIRLKERNPRQYEVINCRFFGGLTVKQTAELLEVSVGSVERDWRLARIKLFAELRDTLD